jgi:hypothetical protein
VKRNGLEENIHRRTLLAQLCPERSFGTLGNELCKAGLWGHVEKKKKIPRKIFLGTFLEISPITYPIIINS